MNTRRFVLALAAASAVGACGPTDDGVLEPEVGQVAEAESSLVSQTAQAKLADLQLQGLLLGDPKTKKTPLGIPNRVPPLIAGIAESFGVHIDVGCAHVESYADADHDGVPQALSVELDCLDVRLGGAYRRLTGVVRLSDLSDKVAYLGFRVRFEALKYLEHTPFVGNIVRELDGAATVVHIRPTPLFAKGWVGINSDLSWRFANVKVMHVDEVRYSTHTHGVFQLAAPPIAMPEPGIGNYGTLHLEGSGAISVDGDTWDRFTYETDPVLSYSRRCEKVYAQAPGFYGGAVTYSGGGAPLRIEFEACNAWKLDEGGG